MADERLGVEGDPIEYLSGIDRSQATGWVAFKISVETEEHRRHPGYLDQNARTGELRDAFLYDYSWTCEECREHKEEKEGERFLEAFEDREMWVTVLSAEADRRRLQERSNRLDICYAVVPIWTRQLVALTTGPVDDTSGIIENHRDISDLVMCHRWVGKKLPSGRRRGLSSTHGFLPPAREYNHFETYHKGEGVRCWHLHQSREAAWDCIRQMRYFYRDLSKGWYVRGTTPWHRVGRLSVTGPDLEPILDDCGISYTRYEADKVADLKLEPLTWDDPKMERLLVEAGWEPPRDDFQIPPIQLELRVAIRHGRISGHGRIAEIG
jgi:hypothetical protein